jgi:hypothetical protein
VPAHVTLRVVAPAQEVTRYKPAWPSGMCCRTRQSVRPEPPRRTPPAICTRAGAQVSIRRSARRYSVNTGRFPRRVPGDGALRHRQAKHKQDWGVVSSDWIRLVRAECRHHVCSRQRQYSSGRDASRCTRCVSSGSQSIDAGIGRASRHGPLTPSCLYAERIRPGGWPRWPSSSSCTSASCTDSPTG